MICDRNQRAAQEQRKNASCYRKKRDPKTSSNEHLTSFWRKKRSENYGIRRTYLKKCSFWNWSHAKCTRTHENRIVRISSRPRGEQKVAPFESRDTVRIHKNCQRGDPRYPLDDDKWELPKLELEDVALHKAINESNLCVMSRHSVRDTQKNCFSSVFSGPIIELAWSDRIDWLNRAVSDGKTQSFKICAETYFRLLFWNSVVRPVEVHHESIAILTKPLISLQ